MRGGRRGKLIWWYHLVSIFGMGVTAVRDSHCSVCDACGSELATTDAGLNVVSVPFYTTNIQTEP